jgi:hypothetical protein
MSTTAATFTIEDLETRASSVIDAVRRFGRARIEVGEREVFEIKVEAPQKPDMQAHRDRYEAHRRKLRELGHDPQPMTEEERERFNKIIAGEI